MLDQLKNIFKKKKNKGVCKTLDIPVGTSKIVLWNKEEIAIFNVDNQFYAISNICAHKGGPLGEGECKGAVVSCPWHIWKYDVTTGKCIMNDKSVKKYEIKIIDGEIFV